MENKIREIETKVAIAGLLVDRLNYYEQAIRYVAESLVTRLKQLSDEGFHNKASTQDPINQAGRLHNQTVQDLDAVLPLTSIDTSNKADEANPVHDCSFPGCEEASVENQKVTSLKDYLDYGRKRIETLEGPAKKAQKNCWMVPISWPPLPRKLMRMAPCRR